MAENLADAKVLFTLRWNSDAITTVAFLDDRTIAAGNRQGNILVWNLPKQGEMEALPARKLAGHTNEINRLLVTPDGKLLISASSDRTVKFWDATLTTGEPGEVVLNDGLVRASVTEKQPKLPDPPAPIAATVVVQKPLRELASHQDWIWGLALSRDGKTLVTGDDAGAVIVSDVQTGEQRCRWTTKLWVRALDLSPDGTTVVTAENFPQVKFSEQDSGVRGWDAASGELKFDVSQELKCGMAAVRFSDDGKHLAICQGNIDREGEAGKVFLLDPATGKLLRALKPPHFRGATDLVFHRDGQHLFTCGRDRLVKVWRLSDGALVRDLGEMIKGQSESFHALSLTPNGKLLAVADGVGQVVIYSLFG